jgi:hypothetical protein
MSIYPHKHDNAAPVYHKDGKYWVSHADLLANEYECLEDFSIVYLNGRFYELQAHVPKANAWWIEPIEIGGDVDAPEEAESPQADSESGEEVLRPDDGGTGE